MDKRCPKCGETKLIENFGKNKNTKDGKNIWCFECARKGSLNYYYAHLERSKEVNKEVMARIKADPERYKQRLKKHFIYQDRKSVV